MTDNEAVNAMESGLSGHHHNVAGAEEIHGTSFAEIVDAPAVTSVAPAVAVVANPVTEHEMVIPHAGVAMVAAEPIDADVELAESHRTKRAEYISVTFIKPSSDTKLGIKVKDESNGVIRIISLKPDGMLHSSPLRAGDMILSINGKTCAELDRNTAGELFRQLVGTICVIARNHDGDPNIVETLVEKPTKDARVGLGVRQSVQGILEISKIASDGLFAQSIVNVGDRVLSINGVDAQRLEPRSAMDIIRNSEKYVTIVTKIGRATGFVVATSDVPHDAALATASVSGLNQEDFLRFRHHACFCIWMIIISLVLIGVTIYQKG